MIFWSINSPYIQPHSPATRLFFLGQHLYTRKHSTAHSSSPFPWSQKARQHPRLTYLSDFLSCVCRCVTTTSIFPHFSISFYSFPFFSSSLSHSPSISLFVIILFFPLEIFTLSVSSDDMASASGFYISFSQHILYTLVSDGAKKNIMVASRTVWNGIFVYSIALCPFNSRKFCVTFAR
jgi:hypothetical protein